MNQEKIIGTNCYNCIFVSKKEEPIDPKELNDQGGLDPKTPNDM